VRCFVGLEGINSVELCCRRATENPLNIRYDAVFWGFPPNRHYPNAFFMGNHCGRKAAHSMTSLMLRQMVV
jgi:hypothetical protein